jgi:hypothetical protein
MPSRIGTRERAAAVDGTEDGDAAIHPAFHRAILKIALELKKPNAPSYDAIVQSTIRAMRLDAVKFRKYLGENGARNMSLLLATARTMGP